MMRVVGALAVGWLLMFWADSGMAILGSLLSWLIGFNLLSPLQTVIGGLVVVSLPLLWLAVGLSPRLPARVFLPPLLFYGWAILGGSPLSVWALGTPWFGFSVALVQGAVAGWTAWQVSRLDLQGRTLEFGARADRPPIRWSRFAAWSGGFLLLGPPLVLAYGWLSLDLILRYHTGGYLALQTDGIAATHRVFERDDRTIDLIGMVHMGDSERYQTLFATIPTEGTLVLEEGVGDAEGLLLQGPIYDRVAERMGLSVQLPIHAMSDLSTRNADVDVSTFSPETRSLLGMVFGIYQAEEPASAFLDYYLFMQGQEDMEALGRTVYGDLITQRNAHLLGVLNEELEDHRRVVVPWGAYHMPEIEERVVTEGFQQVSEQRTTLIPFPWGRGE